MTASMIVPQPIYQGLTLDKIDIKLPAIMLKIMGNAKILQELTLSTNPYFEDFPTWKFLLAEFDEYNPTTKSNEVSILYSKILLTFSFIRSFKCDFGLIL